MVKYGRWPHKTSQPEETSCPSLAWASYMQWFVHFSPSLCGSKTQYPHKNSKPLVSCKMQQSCSVMGLNDSKHVAGVGWCLLYLPSRQQVQIGVAKKPVQTHGRTFLKNPATVWPFSTSRFDSSPMMNRWQQVPQCSGLFPRCGSGQQLLLILGEWCHRCLKKKQSSAWWQLTSWLETHLTNAGEIKCLFNKVEMN